MLSFPTEIISNILYYCDEKIIIDLSTVSTRIKKIIEEPRFWCQLLIDRNKYDDFTFYSQYDTERITYHRSCLSKGDSFPIQSVFDITWYNVNDFCQLWQIIKSLPTYDDFDNYEDNPIINKLKDCFEWALDRFALYQTFSSSTYNFYRILLTVFNWKETCRLIKGRESCSKSTAICSLYCTDCRMQHPISYLLEHSINKSGSYQVNLFDRLKKKEYIKRDGIQFYYHDESECIIHNENNKIYHIGKLIGHKVKYDNPTLFMVPKEFVRDKRIYDFVDYDDYDPDPDEHEYHYDPDDDNDNNWVEGGSNTYVDYYS